ncbi:MAG: hypothetical protein KDD50_12435 [Bdellovibrionales bacterium]|nr:hypothetical protein [Bdellovibrionales bacterium]
MKKLILVAMGVLFSSSLWACTICDKDPGAKDKSIVKVQKKEQKKKQLNKVSAEKKSESTLTAQSESN